MYNGDMSTKYFKIDVESTGSKQLFLRYASRHSDESWAESSIYFYWDYVTIEYMGQDTNIELVDSDVDGISDSHDKDPHLYNRKLAFILEVYHSDVGEECDAVSRDLTDIGFRVWLYSGYDYDNTAVDLGGYSNIYFHYDSYISHSDVRDGDEDDFASDVDWGHSDRYGYSPDDIIFIYLDSHGSETEYDVGFDIGENDDFDFCTQSSDGVDDDELMGEFSDMGEEIEIVYISCCYSYGVQDEEHNDMGINNYIVIGADGAIGSGVDDWNHFFKDDGDSAGLFYREKVSDAFDQLYNEDNNWDIIEHYNTAEEPYLT